MSTRSLFKITTVISHGHNVLPVYIPDLSSNSKRFLLVVTEHPKPSVKFTEEELREKLTEEEYRVTQQQGTER